MSYLRFAALVLGAFLAPALIAQSVETEPLFLPLAPQRVAGAFGSEWDTHLVVTNLSDTPVGVYGYQPFDGCLGCGPQPPIPPRATIYIYLTNRSDLVRGVSMSVDRGRSRDLAITLRSRDLSRSHETWGTVVPVVRPDDLRVGRFGFTDIPLTGGFRALVRVYDTDARTAPRARMRVYAVNPERDYPRTTEADVLLLDRELLFTVPTDATDQLFYPGYAEVSLSAEPALAGASRVRVEIEPLTGERQYWGFATITHNETQHVTVLQP